MEKNCIGPDFDYTNFPEPLKRKLENHWALIHTSTVEQFLENQWKVYGTCMEFTKSADESNQQQTYFSKALELKRLFNPKHALRLVQFPINVSSILQNIKIILLLNLNCFV